MMRFWFAFVFSVLIWAVPAPAQDGPVYNIENITGDLYRFQSNAHYGVFLVTEEGIILADPISHDTATWLKAELDKRFGLPVKYVIYSHDHADHTSGGEVFQDTATFVGHAFAVKKIEESGHTPVPDKMILREGEIKLGEKVVRLFNFWSSHTDNLLTMYFPEEKAVFLVDAVGVQRLPYRDLPSTEIHETLFYLSEVEKLDFEILIPGHGKIGNKKDLTDFKGYLGNLLHAVSIGKKLGKSLATLKETILLEEYSTWDMYGEWRALNIEGVFRQAASENKAGNSEKPQPLKKAQPFYPRNAYQIGAEGWVVVEFDVNGKGRPENIEVLASDATSKTRGVNRIHEMAVQFEKSVIQAYSKYRFPKNNPIENYRAIVWFGLKPPGKGGSYFQMEAILARGNLPR